VDFSCLDESYRRPNVAGAKCYRDKMSQYYNVKEQNVAVLKMSWG
jgi:hypothetical protein